MRFLKLLSLCVLSAGVHGGETAKATPVGDWQRVHHKTGKVVAIIRIEAGGDRRLSGKIIRLANAASNAHAQDTKIIWDLEQKSERIWKNGKFLEIDKGKVYDLQIEIIDFDKIKVRGYVGMYVIGETEYWLRVPPAKP